MSRVRATRTTRSSWATDRHTRSRSNAVPPGARVLDIGCGPGQFAELLQAKGATVDGADQFAPSNPSAFGRFFLWREGESLEADLHDYDVVLMLDIIEHLNNPEAFLDQLRRNARSTDRRPSSWSPRAMWSSLIVRLQALLGNFNYGKRGILDLTHTRLYTFKTIRRLFEDCGFIIEEIRGIPAPFPEALGAGRLSRLLVSINSALIALSTGTLCLSDLPAGGSDGHGGRVARRLHRRERGESRRARKKAYSHVSDATLPDASASTTTLRSRAPSKHR